jgi:large subunit ribosomal protein L15
MPGIIPIKHPSNKKRTTRKGYGLGSGKGRTCGRGTKGAGSRSGNTETPRFEGGQQPLVRHLPKLGGFKHHSKPFFHPVNLGDLGGIPDGGTVDLLTLEGQGLLPKRLRGVKVKLLAGGASGELGKKINCKLDAYSNKAREIIERAGGTCEVR